MSRDDYRKISIVDSGLGGLSTTADLYRKLRERSPAESVDLIFFNALADWSLGYQAMRTVEQKIAVFNNALQSMYDQYHPDYILIACNTLSVIHEQTEFTRKGIVPVIGIVDASVRQMLEFLRAEPTAAMIIFGTKTTTDSGTYPRRLMEAGIAPERIVAEACSTVHVEIEKDINGSQLRELIQTHVAAALARVKNREAPIGASLNCTHYGYAAQHFEAAFRLHGAPLRALLNPNTTMGDFLLEGATHTNARVAIRIVSQVALEADNIATMAQLISPTAPDVAQALHRYEHRPDLFAWKPFQNSEVQ